jgi:hypothetical protein
MSIVMKYAGEFMDLGDKSQYMDEYLRRVQSVVAVAALELQLGNKLLFFSRPMPDDISAKDLTSKGDFWACIELVRQILVANSLDYPEISGQDRGRLAPIRKVYVDWGVREGFLENGDAPSIPIKLSQLHRFIPSRFFGLRNYVWRILTLPNRHRMKYSWDIWRAI